MTFISSVQNSRVAFRERFVVIFCNAISLRYKLIQHRTQMGFANFNVNGYTQGGSLQQVKIYC